MRTAQSGLRVLNASIGCIISLCDEKRYPNSLLREYTMQTRESYYVPSDIPALHLPLTKSITAAEEDKAFRVSLTKCIGW